MKNLKDEKNKIILSKNTFFDYESGSVKWNYGKEVFMEYRLKELFYLFLNNRNEVITREKLMSLLWKDIVVNDESISKAVSDLRKFFIANHLDDFNIITIRKIGYKLNFYESVISNQKKVSTKKLFLKILSYSVLGLLLIIILIRAIKY